MERDNLHLIGWSRLDDSFFHSNDKCCQSILKVDHEIIQFNNYRPVLEKVDICIS